MRLDMCQKKVSASEHLRRVFIYHQYHPRASWVTGYEEMYRGGNVNKRNNLKRSSWGFLDRTTPLLPASEYWKSYGGI